MKRIALAAALMIGTAAVAQTTPPADQTMTPPASPAPDTTTPPTDTTMAPSTPTPADPQAGATLPGNMTAAPQPQASYPRCSATATDQCRQSSARESDYRGGPPAHRRHRRG